MLKFLQRKVNRGYPGTEHISVEQIRANLVSIKYIHYPSVGYEPAFNNNEVIKRMQAATGIIIDNEIITKKMMGNLLKAK